MLQIFHFTMNSNFKITTFQNCRIVTLQDTIFLIEYDIKTSFYLKDLEFWRLSQRPGFYNIHD